VLLGFWLTPKSWSAFAYFWGTLGQALPRSDPKTHFVTKRFIRARRAAGLGHFRLHDLRHFMATEMQMSDVAVFTSFRTGRDDVPPGEMNWSGNVVVRPSREEYLVGAGMHHP
jgi:hypothetical protein